MIHSVHDVMSHLALRSIHIEPPLSQKLHDGFRTQVLFDLGQQDFWGADIRWGSHDLGTGLATVDDEVGAGGGLAEARADDHLEPVHEERPAGGLVGEELGSEVVGGGVHE
jgi:hypothetical protein